MTLSAEFLAVMQIIVYSGAILILFVFVIALLSSGVAPFAIGPNRLPRAGVPAAICAARFGFLARASSTAVRAPSFAPVVPIAGGGTAGDGERRSAAWPTSATRCSTMNLLPFEVTAFILMVAVIGVVLMAGDEAARSGRAAHAAQPIQRSPSASRSPDERDTSEYYILVCRRCCSSSAWSA